MKAAIIGCYVVGIASGLGAMFISFAMDNTLAGAWAGISAIWAAGGLTGFLNYAGE